MNNNAKESKKQTISDEELSIYSSKIENGLAKFREEHSDQPNIDIVRCVKRVIFGDKKGIENESLSVLVATFKEIVNICNLTVEEYNRSWSVAINKKMFLENISRKITALASDEDKEECAFQRKRLLFKIVYPDYYKENFNPIKPYDLIHVGGEDKASLVRAAKPLINKEEKENTEITSDGAIVDRIIMKAINAGFKTSDVTDKIQIMKNLTDEKAIRDLGDSSAGQKSSLPGCFHIINERKCYDSYIDFYFLNLPKEEQLLYVDDFMKIREEAGIKPNPLMNKFYEIFQENRDEFLNNICL